MALRKCAVFFCICLGSWSEDIIKSSTLIPAATTAGGNVLENRYGRDFCRSRSISSLGPVVYPPAAPPSAFPRVEFIISTLPDIWWNSSVPLKILLFKLGYLRELVKWSLVQQLLSIYFACVTWVTCFCVLVIDVWLSLYERFVICINKVEIRMYFKKDKKYYWKIKWNKNFIRLGFSSRLLQELTIRLKQSCKILVYAKYILKMKQAKSN